MTATVATTWTPLVPAGMGHPGGVGARISRTGIPTICTIHRSAIKLLGDERQVNVLTDKANARFAVQPTEAINAVRITGNVNGYRLGRGRAVLAALGLDPPVTFAVSKDPDSDLIIFTAVSS